MLLAVDCYVQLIFDYHYFLSRTGIYSFLFFLAVSPECQDVSFSSSSYNKLTAPSGLLHI